MSWYAHSFSRFLGNISSPRLTAPGQRSPLVVGVFMDQGIEEVVQKAQGAQVDAVQLHGGCLATPSLHARGYIEPRASVCVCVSTPVPKGSLPTSTFFTAGGHPPPQWRMANEEATGGGCKRTCYNC